MMTDKWTPVVELGQIVQELTEYTRLCNDEYSEYCEALCSLASHTDYLPLNLKKELLEEMYAQLKYFKEHAEMVEKTQTRTVTYQELEWRDD